MDNMNSAFEERRRIVIDDLKQRLNSSSGLSTEEVELFKSTIDALEELTQGVNSAHVRIALRKKELQLLDHNMKTLAAAIREIIDGVESIETNISKQIAEQNKKNRRFYIGISIASCVIIGFMAYISFGSKETISTLASLTQALKLVDVII